jgi:hypothetical protein
MPIRDQAEIERSIRALAGVPVSGLIVLPDGLAVAHSQLVIDLVAQYRLPAVYPFRDFVEAGGLVSYGMKVSENFRQRPTTSIASFAEPILPISLCRLRPNTRPSSTSRPPRHCASMCLCFCSSSPTR